MSAEKVKRLMKAKDYTLLESEFVHPYSFRKAAFKEVIQLVEERGHSPVTIDLFIKAAEVAKRSRALDEAINDFVDCRDTFFTDIDNLPKQIPNPTANSQ